jgi:acetate kinase
VRHVGRKERRDDDGFRRRVRPADGDPLGRCATGRIILPAPAQAELFDDTSLEKMLYERAGLLGLSGMTGDMRVLQESAAPRAVAAVEYFVYAMTKYAGAYAAVLGGLDAFVFTAGIGENSDRVRAALCHKLAWLGVTLDERANSSGGPRISTPDSAVSVWVIPTNEELMIAQHTLALIRPTLS